MQGGRALDKEMKWKEKNLLFIVFSVMGAVIFSAFLYFFTMSPDISLRGTDIFGHFFKINILGESLKNGVFYPIYTPYWYNGIELFRYWPPFAYYVAVLIQFLTNTDVLDAHYIFIGVVYFVNMCGWRLLGKREKAIGKAFLFGNLFFFCPDNMRLILAEGNLPRIFMLALLPYIFYFVWEILEYKNLKKLSFLTIVIVLATLTHFMIAAMIGISIFLFAFIYSIMNRRFGEWIFITVDLVLAYMSVGLFLIPGLLGGGLTSQSSEASVETISQWAQEAIKSLNPFFRVDGGNVSSFYFGLAIFIIAILGCIAANKKMGPGFLSTVFIFFSTTTVASTIVRLLPMSQVFWMQRFVPMAMCMCFLSLLLWKNLKRSALIIFTVMMILDSAVEISLLVEEKEESIQEVVDKRAESYLLSEAKKLTKNRLGMLDYSMRGSIPSFYLTEDMDQTNVSYSFGWAYQGAETIENIVSVNEAAEDGFYEYSFDRLLELGDDVVLVDKKEFPKEDADSIIAAANQAGYSLYKENEEAWLFYIEEVEGTFGIIKEYDSLAIGENAREICYIYPDFGWGKSSLLDEYTLEELTKYHTLYLSGFSYQNKEKAEQLIKDAADEGVQIYIDMQQIPLDKLSGKAEFLGVHAQFVTFTEKFPVLSTDNGSQFKLDFKTAGYERWNTVYLTGAEEEIKKAYYDDATRLTYVAKNGNPNITFLGFNPVYYYHESKNEELLIFLNEIFDKTPGEICQSHIVPISVDYGKDFVKIQSEYDDVNTGIANLDCFVIDETTGAKRMSAAVPKQEKHNLLIVDKGLTVFKVRYSHLGLGLSVSLMGIIGSIIFCIKMSKREKGD